MLRRQISKGETILQAQEIFLLDSQATTWILLDDDHVPVEPVNRVLKFLRETEKSPNTIKNYAHHYKLYWQFLKDEKLLWNEISLEDLARFITWLRRSKQPGIINLDKVKPKRTASTVNTIMAAVSTFYDFHERAGGLKKVPMMRLERNPHKRYKPLLHHISKVKPEERSLLKLKEPESLPKTLKKDQVERVIAAATNHRDKFLIGFLDETGARIGEALGLRHSDIVSYDNQIVIVKRDGNGNGARAKGAGRTLDVSRDLMVLYQNYLIYELGDDLSDYVFVNLWEGKIGHPLTYSTVVALFRRLSKKVGFHVTPHMFRHTHATENLRAGNDLKKVQERLGHKQIQSTQVYVHLDRSDMKKAHQKFVERRESLRKTNGGNQP